MLLSVIPPLQPMRVTRCLDPGSGQDPSNPKITNITDQEYYSNNIFMKHAYTDLKQVPREKGKAHHHVLEFKNSTGESEREGGAGTNGLLTSLRRSWRVLDAGDAVKAEIRGGGGG